MKRDRAENQHAPGTVAGSLVLSGYLIRVVVVPPGHAIPEADPGRARRVLDLDGGYRLAYLSQGPTATTRDQLEEFHRRHGAEIGPIDWRELEADLFGPDAIAA